LADLAATTAAPAGGWRLVPALVAAASFVWFLGFVGPVARGGTPHLALPWIPALEIELAFRIDGLSLAFALLITGIGALILLYAASYFRHDYRLGSLLATLVAFALSMLGLVTADDAITLFVFWEATTITSWLLVGFDHERATARSAALQALLVTGLGGLALLAGLLLMSVVADTYRLSEMTARGDALRASAFYPAILALVVTGCFAKSAQFPFHFWLPNAMAAPTPVSAYLHSATMVKAGVYLLARLTPALGGTDAWTIVLVSGGTVTMLLGAVWAMRQADLKLMLAQTTVMALGLVTLLLGIGSAAAVAAAMTFLLIHAFYKAALFLAVGMIDKGTGTRDVTALAGLARAMPVTAATAAVAALSMAGIPPLLGFIGKELVYEATLGGPRLALVTTLAAVAANALMVTAAGMVAVRPFAGALRAPRTPADPDWGLWLGPALLGALGLLFGLAPLLIEAALVAPMVWAVHGSAMEGHLALWHGVGPTLLLSLATWALGIAAYAGLDPLRRGLAAAEPRLPRTEGWYQAGLHGIAAAAAELTGALQNGRMTSYLRASFLTLGLLIWGAVLAGTASWPNPELSPLLLDWAICGVIVASITVVLATRSRLTAIAALGGVGAGIALLFVAYGAIDVAMTQICVEILVVVFLAIAMVRLPTAGPATFRRRDALIAGILGTGVTLAALAVLGTDLDLTLTRYFEATSVPVALGHNIVNVILVDFRGFDTLGEIAVVVIAGVAAIAALRAGGKPPR
jgi:multicomponent Na+:H+ antiporter subunit A